MATTLSELRTRLGERLAETSTEFWGSDERDRYLNDAQRRIAVMTGGVPWSFTESGAGGSSGGNVYFDLTGVEVVGPSEVGAHLDDGTILNVIPRNEIDRIWPGWRTADTDGSPKWVVLDVANQRAYVVPGPTSSTNINLNVAILPSDMTTSSDEMFEGADPMERYRDAVVQLAATMALLKERYEKEAERFYQMFQAEMQELGINPNSIPRLDQIQQEVEE